MIGENELAATVLLSVACGLAGVCLTMLGFAIKRYIDGRDDQNKTLLLQDRAILQLQDALRHVQEDQRAHADHARQIADVRATVGRLDERSRLAETFMRGIAQTNQQILRRLDTQEAVLRERTREPATVN